MSKSKKKLGGEGWTFIPADDGKAEDAAPSTSQPPSEQSIRVCKEKRAKGKVVTVASGFVLTPPDLKALAKKLKQQTSSGGSTTVSTIELQGEHIETTRAFFTKQGYRVR